MYIVYDIFFSDLLTTRGNWEFPFASLHLDLPVAQTLKLSVNVGLIQVLTSLAFCSHHLVECVHTEIILITRSDLMRMFIHHVDYNYFTLQVSNTSNNYNFCIFLTILEINWYWFCIIKKFFLYIIVHRYIISFFAYLTQKFYF